MLAGGLLALAAWIVHMPPPSQADEIPEKYRGTVEKGLEYLVKNQHKDGHWEGDELVVETTNFTNQTAIGVNGNGNRHSTQLKLIERFKRVDEHTILYRFTVDDPKTWTRSWTAEYPFLATAGPIFEYACHEGNYAMKHILSGARADEKE